MEDENEMYRRLEAIFASDQLLWSHLRSYCQRLQSKEESVVNHCKGCYGRPKSKLRVGCT